MCIAENIQYLSFIVKTSVNGPDRLKSGQHPYIDIFSTFYTFYTNVTVSDTTSWQSYQKLMFKRILVKLMNDMTMNWSQTHQLLNVIKKQLPYFLNSLSRKFNSVDFRVAGLAIIRCK